MYAVPIEDVQQLSRGTIALITGGLGAWCQVYPLALPRELLHEAVAFLKARPAVVARFDTTIATGSTGTVGASEPGSEQDDADFSLVAGDAACWSSSTSDSPAYTSSGVTGIRRARKGERTEIGSRRRP